MPSCGNAKEQCRDSRALKTFLYGLADLNCQMRQPDLRAGVDGLATHDRRHQRRKCAMKRIKGQHQPYKWDV